MSLNNYSMAQGTPNVRVRIAPSPTGNLHVGTARAALFNELFARGQGGVFIVRIEDTDPARSKPEFEENILEGLKWLGLQWQEGPDVGGHKGPYRQSERGELYQGALQKLLDGGQAYLEGEAIKLQVAPQEISFVDAIRGEVKVHTDSFGGDFVIARSIKDPLYHLAVVADDAAMEISHVIRGEDHISNTFKHILIQRALGHPEPHYAHLPLLLDENRRKLSKRSGETNLLAYRDRGYLPQAMMNYLALLGWNPGDEREFFSHEGLAKEFSLAKVQKQGAIFSTIKLEAINKHYLRLLSADELLAAAGPFLTAAGIDMSNPSLLAGALKTEQERVGTLAELPEAIALFLPTWRADYPPEDLVWKKSSPATTMNLLKRLHEKTSALSDDSFRPDKLRALLVWIDDEQLGRGDTLWPFRVALTGRQHSPGPFEVAAVLGKTQTLHRISLAIQKLDSLL